MKSALKNITIIICVICILLFFLYVGAMLFARNQAFNMMTTDEKANYDIFKNQRMTFNKSDVYPDPFSSETLKAADDFLRYQNDLSFTGTEIGIPYTTLLYPENVDFYGEAPSTHTADTLVAAGQACDKYIDLWLELINREDFHGETLIVAQDPSHYADLSEFRSPKLEYLACLICLKAGSIVKDGEPEKALGLLENSVSGLYSTKYSSSVLNWEIMAFKERLLGDWAYAVSNSDDVERLRKTFQFQETLYPSEDIRSSLSDSFIGDVIVPVRLLSRFGVRVEIQNHTIKEIADMIVTGEMEKIYRKKVVEPNLEPTSITIYQDVVRDAERMKGPLDKLNQTFWPLLSPGLSPYRYINTGYDYLLYYYYDESEVQQLEVSVDLLRIQTAARIYYLQHGKMPERIDALVPEFFDKAPLDKFATPPQPYRSINGKYYSVGADGNDDMMMSPQSIYEYLFGDGTDIFLVSIFDLPYTKETTGTLVN